MSSGEKTNAEGGVTWNWDEDIKSESEAIAKYGKGTYYAAPGYSYPVEGNKEVVLGVNNWGYRNIQKNVNWSEFQKNVNMMQPLLDATALGVTTSIYALAAYAGGANGFMGLTYTSGGSALADFGMQMFYNGWDISKLNRTSVVAALLFKM